MKVDDKRKYYNSIDYLESQNAQVVSCNKRLSSQYASMQDLPSLGELSGLEDEDEQSLAQEVEQ